MPQRTCSVDGCERSAKSRGWCRIHYARWQRHGDPDHALRDAKGCCVDGCGRSHKGLGYCGLHYRRVKSTGNPGAGRPSQKRTMLVDGWTVHGSGHTDVHGYRFMVVPGHPNAYKRGIIAEHRFVMSAHLGRALYPDEVVHHKNGDRGDNRRDNLELKTQYHGKGQSVTDRIADALFILERYAPELLTTDPVQLQAVA